MFLTAITPLFRALERGSPEFVPRLSYINWSMAAASAAHHDYDAACSLCVSHASQHQYSPSFSLGHRQHVLAQAVPTPVVVAGSSSAAPDIYAAAIGATALPSLMAAEHPPHLHLHQAASVEQLVSLHNSVIVSGKFNPRLQAVLLINLCRRLNNPPPPCPLHR